MALDNAQFISELSITDPPGTDAVAEGDDHIRTTKRATQQSFPNVDAAVPQTAAQMAQMAIKNEANTFTQINNFTNRAIFQSDFLEIQPLVADDNAQVRFRDENGFVRWETGRVNTTTSGDWRVRRFDSAGVFQDTPFQIAQANGFITFDSGAIEFPGSSVRIRNFLTSDDSRILWIGEAATQRWNIGRERTTQSGDFILERFSSAGVLQSKPFAIHAGTGTMRSSSGTAADPQYSFQSDAGMGMFRLSNNTLGFAIDGVERFSLSPTLAIFNAAMRVADGNAALPSFTFSNNTDMGMFRDSSNVLAFATQGATRMLMTSVQVQVITNLDCLANINAFNLPTGPGGLPSGQFYAKQSQLFAPTELVLGIVP